MYTTVHRIAFHDCDPAGVLFFGSIFHLAHTVYEEWLHKNKFHDYIFRSKKSVYPIISADALYHSPIRFGSEIRIELKVANVSTSSFQLMFRFYDKSKRLLGQAATVHVCVDKNAGKKSPLLPKIKRFLECHSKNR
jgi:YbgC/YbaW family acyl-CoA thioester hydrolase